MDELICPAPARVPPDLAAPNAGYWRGVWWSLVALSAFVAIYLALTGWFVWTVWRMGVGVAHNPDDLTPFILIVPMAVLALFMLKALFFRIRDERVGYIEIDATREPRLFAFLHRIADEVGTARPHRVYLVAQVNAGAFHDFSLLNLVVPSRKNLEIGLGLVNVLTLGELRAVLAHEFGHFAQRAMAVGRWAQMARRAAAQIVHKRDLFDEMLHKISVADLRVAWIGWGARVVLWSLRSVLDTAFVFVVRAQNALSHEMERQADLVSVTVAGSDTPVNALHKLVGADLAWDQALQVAANRLKNGEVVADLFAMQTRALEHGRRVLADERFGAAPTLPQEGRAQYRVFQRRLGNPPRMWSTHPSNRDREDNIKQTYVPCEPDDRSAWELFADPAPLRAEVTKKFLDTLHRSKVSMRPLAPEEGLAAIDRNFDHAYFDPRFRGLYLGRSVVQGAKTVDALYSEVASASETTVDGLYPQSLRDALAKWKSLEAEAAQLEGLRRGLLDASGRELQFRGEALRKRDIPRRLEAVRAECGAARAVLEAADRRIRTAHLAAATRVGRGWPEHLRGLAALLHYADHTEADLRDARGYVANVYAIVTADRRVSKSERRRLANAGFEVHDAMKAAWEAREAVTLPSKVASALGVERWAQALPKTYDLPPPNPHQIREWLNVIDGWLNAFLASFGTLERCCLEALLEAEGQVSAMAREPASVVDAPAPASTPSEYGVLLPGDERERQWRLGAWDRFQVADGFLPSLSRLSVAGGIVGCIVALGMWIGMTNVVVVNGLGRRVVVHVGSEERSLAPFEKTTFVGVREDHLHVSAETTAGELIEAFDEPLARAFDRVVYNVAGAAPLVRSTAAPPEAQPTPDEELGAVRSMTTDDDFVLERPPERLPGQVALRVLTALADVPPTEALARVADAEARDALVRVHATWDEGDLPNTPEWLRLASGRLGFEDVVKARLTREPGDVATLRAEQDQPSALARSAACARQTQLAAAAPDDGNLRYLALRCLPRGRARDDALVAAFADKTANRWLALEAGDVGARRADWRHALAAWETARESRAPRDTLLFDTARVMRVLGADLAPDLHKLALESPGLRQLLALDGGGETSDGSRGAYASLARGALGEALGAADADARARLVRLVGASRGATPEQVASALALPPSAGIDTDTIWPAVGLALREGKDATGLIASLGQSLAEDEKAAVFEVLHPERWARDADVLTGPKFHVDTPTRGHALAMACVILGDRAPVEWRRLANALLFATERPYL